VSAWELSNNGMHLTVGAPAGMEAPPAGDPECSPDSKGGSVTAFVLVATVLQGSDSVGTVADSPAEAVLRAIAAQDRSRYFVSYCVAVVPGEVTSLPTQQDRIKNAWGIDGPDAPSVVLRRLSDLPHRFAPASECMKSDGDYDGCGAHDQERACPLGRHWARTDPVTATCAA
jgi:hypothetical protein